MEKRFHDIETKFSFQEDAIERLDIELRTQQQEIIELKEELMNLRSLVLEREEHINDLNEKPPHY
mgnify:FL=1